MLGRTNELAFLNELHSSNKFEFLIMYGRRRVGKTTILEEFIQKDNTIFFPAKEKNDSLNLHDFSKLVQLHFDKKFYYSFNSWEQAFEYIGDKVTNRTTIIIDEFPYLIEENPTIKSILQHTIDHKWKNKNIFLILCGSSVSVMENELMGAKSPLHNRQTATLEVKPFNYYEMNLFFPNYSNLDKIITYGILGGIPRYLEAFDNTRSIEYNICNKILKNGAHLNEEPTNLLKSELRETNVYNSILSAISSGRNRITEIADFIHEERTKVSKYLNTLQTLRLIDKIKPCGESETSKKTIYVLKDNFFKFWFRYEFTDNSYYNMLGYEDAAREIMADLPNHMGLIFEDICKEYLILLAKNKKLTFIPYHLGKWWGNNKFIKAEDGIDVLAIDKTNTKAIFMECKFTNTPMPLEEYNDLVKASEVFSNIKEKHFYFVSKSGYTEPVKRQAKLDGDVLLSIDDLFNV